MLRWVVVCRGWWRWVDSLVGWSGWLCVLRSCCARETRGFRGCTSGTARQNTEPVSRGSHHLRFNYFPLEVCRIASRVFPLSASISLFEGFSFPRKENPFPPLPLFNSREFSFSLFLYFTSVSLPRLVVYRGVLLISFSWYPVDERGIAQ